MEQVDFPGVPADPEEQPVFSQDFILTKSAEHKQSAENAQSVIHKQDAVQLPCLTPESGVQQDDTRKQSKWNISYQPGNTVR